MLRAIGRHCIYREHRAIYKLTAAFDKRHPQLTMLPLRSRYKQRNLGENRNTDNAKGLFAHCPRFDRQPSFFLFFRPCETTGNADVSWMNTGRQGRKGS